MAKPGEDDEVLDDEKDLDSADEEEDEEDADDEGGDQDDSDEDDSSDDAQPPIRRSAAYYIGLRQGKRAAKNEAPSNNEDEESGEGDEELTPKARAAIEKKLDPVVKVMMDQADDLEIREYLDAHPEKRKYEKEIRKRASDWKDVPISEIGKTVGQAEEAANRSKRRDQIVKRANQKRLGGSSARGEEGTKLPTTRKEQEAIYARVKRGETIKLGE